VLIPKIRMLKLHGEVQPHEASYPVLQRCCHVPGSAARRGQVAVPPWPPTWTSRPGRRSSRVTGITWTWPECCCTAPRPCWRCPPQLRPARAGWQQEHWSMGLNRGRANHRNEFPWIPANHMNGLISLKIFDRRCTAS